MLKCTVKRGKSMQLKKHPKKIWIELSVEKGCSMRIRRWHEKDTMVKSMKNMKRNRFILEIEKNRRIDAEVNIKIKIMVRQGKVR